ncbi:cysteine desulfurase family protein [Arenibaculum pallidiluteum]|uniref:cysteine desulfurase family protein n=1 Tax=Arenibaculum pallidiluteum TaxID=2812559 RepID=UPI001A9792C6|nr:aminotransferase class V-fold PLP-dependent enzyme [Arenibaculum pallidiluteum]
MSGGAPIPLAIHLDHQATTPIDPRVLDAMDPWLRAPAANPHARNPLGYRAAEALEKARAQVAALLGANPLEIIWTSGATEANNLALKGIARAARAQGRDHVVTTAIEHPSVLEPCRRLESEGCRIEMLPVGTGGLMTPDAVAAALTPRTALVSVMAANNEIGTLQPIAAIAEACRDRDVPFHTDAAQAFGRVPLEGAADLVSVCAHKLHGPPGIGALRVRRGIALEPLLEGGGQERGLRPGTVPVALAVGFGAAAAIAGAQMAEEGRRIAALRDFLLTRLRAACPELRLNGDAVRRLPGNLNVTLPGVDAEALMLALPELALASGAACASGRPGPSHVLLALGLGPEEAASSLRIGIGRFTTRAEVERAADLLSDALRSFTAGR